MRALSEISIKSKQRRQRDLTGDLENVGDYKIYKTECVDLVPACRRFCADDIASDAGFEAGFSYPFPEVSLTLLRDVYVSRSGAVCTLDGEVVDETLEAGIDQNFDCPFSDFKPIDTVTAASKYGNFNHAIFTMETLPLVILSQMDRQVADKPRPLYFERQYCSAPFVAEHQTLMTCLGLSGGHFDHGVRASRCFVPSTSRRNWCFRASALSGEVADRLRAVAPTDAGLPRRIYVSRRHAPSRVPRQIDALEWIAVRHGYTPVYLERMAPLEQVMLFAQCEAIMAEHGAGLANLQYAPRGCRVLELFPAPMYRKWVFRLAAHCANLVYSTGEFPVEAGWAYNRDGVDIDVGLFERCLDHLDAE